MFAPTCISAPLAVIGVYDLNGVSELKSFWFARQVKMRVACSCSCVCVTVFVCTYCAITLYIYVCVGVGIGICICICICSICMCVCVCVCVRVYVCAWVGVLGFTLKSVLFGRAHPPNQFNIVDIVFLRCSVDACLYLPPISAQIPTC